MTDDQVIGTYLETESIQIPQTASIKKRKVKKIDSSASANKF